MNRLRCLLLFLFGTMLVACGGPGDWQVYNAKEFTIEFPGPAKDTATIEGKLAGVKTFYEPVEGSLDSNLYYSVSMYTLSDSIAELGENLPDFFAADAQIFAWSVGGILSDSGRVVKSGKTEGREFKIVLAENVGVATIRKFAYNKHLYTLLVVTENMRLENTEIRRFMDSFKLK